MTGMNFQTHSSADFTSNISQ
ncbi:hypothetical protein AALB64_00330 [Lachnospiraceae bacterium 45-P1]